jgi:hypothetical protein
MRTSQRVIAVTGACLAALAVAGAANASARPAVHRLASTQVTASTAITNRPDSGAHGDWAQDNFTRAATVKLVGQVGAENCPGTDTGFCYLWDFTIADSGHFTTTADASSPRAGKTLDLALTGAFSGGTTSGQYYSSWKTAKASRVPTTENDMNAVPTGRKTTTNWVEQFYGSSAVFNSAANAGGPDLGRWSWKYTLGFGSDTQCPNNASQWVDAANNSDGSTPPDGDILAPNSSDC